MIDASSSIELREFEHIEAAPGRALLRICARPAAGLPPGTRSTLVVDDGTRLHRLAPLPAPADPNGMLRVAFTAPLKLLEGRTTFALELSNGSVLDLPMPTGRPQSLAPRRDGDRQALLDERTRREQAERRAERAEHEAEQAALARSTALARLDELEQRLIEIQQTSEALQEGLQRQSIEAQARASATATELEEAQTRAATLEEVVRHESARRDQLEESLREREQALAKRQSMSRELETRIALLVEELSSMTAARVDAEETAKRLETELQDAGLEREQAERRAAETSERERERSHDAERGRATEQAMRHLEAQLEAEGLVSDAVRASAIIETEVARRSEKAAETRALAAAEAVADAGSRAEAAREAEQYAEAQAERYRAELEQATEALREAQREARQTSHDLTEARAELQALKRAERDARAGQQSSPASAKRVTRGPTPTRVRPSRAAARIAAAPGGLPARTEGQARGLPSEAKVGIILILVGIVLAVLILTGEIKLGLAP